MSVLRRPHDHHRDLRTRFNAPASANRSDGRDQHRYVYDYCTQVTTTSCSFFAPVLDPPRQGSLNCRTVLAKGAAIFALRHGLSRPCLLANAPLPANIGLRKSCADFGASSARTLEVL